MSSPSDVPSRETIDKLVERIRGYHPRVEALADKLRTPEILSKFDKHEARSWCRSVAGDALIRILQIIQNNFNYIETLGVIAVARYLFELSTWLRLFELDERYGLVYYHELLDVQRRFFEDTMGQLEREVALLRAFAEKEEEADEAVLKRLKSSAFRSDGSADVGALKAIADKIDAEAARHFSLFAEEAKWNGYSFQAYLVETKAVPKAETALEELAREKRSYDERVLPSVKDLLPSRWNWRQMAKAVGRGHEYDYIYSFASKLLHATPASITTNQKNLEASEMIVFLKYIDITIRDVAALARRYA